MKVPDSGMPEETYWESLFDIPLILDRLGLDGTVKDVAELGCGYGTFTIPLARHVSGRVFTFDIDPLMIDRTTARATDADLDNIRFERRDILADGFGLDSETCDACLLFNILHCQRPEAVLREAARILRPNGRMLAIHWVSNVVTPRGPSVEIRPQPNQLQQHASAVGFKSEAVIDLPPWHFGIVAKK